MTEIKIGYNIQTKEPICYNYIPFESRGIAINAVTRSGKSTLIFKLKKTFKDCGLDPQIVSIARDKDELRQRDEIPFILIGNGGEVPIDVKLARQTGENVRRMHVDVIVDINSLKTEKEQDEYISEFLTGLQLDDNERFWKKSCVLFLDEVQIICNSGATRYTRSKDVIARLAQTCIKKNILPVVSSHKMRDFYANARDEITNHVIGYIDNPAQRKFACELLNIDDSASETIRGFQDVKGTFYVEGADIISPATVIQVDANKIYPKGEVIVPKLDLESLQRADGLRESLNYKDIVSIESELRFEIARLQSKVDQLSGKRMDLYKEGFEDAVEKMKRMVSEK